MSYKYNFKAGDKVLIKHTGRKISERWLKGTDRVVTLIEESEGGFTCEIDEVRWFIGYDEIAGYGFDYNQPIEVSQDGVKWETRRYICHADGFFRPWYVSDSLSPNVSAQLFRWWAYARPIEQVKEDAKLTLSERSILLLEDFLRMSKEDTDEIHELFLWLEQSRESLKNTMIK